MACRTGCPTQDHENWGACLKASNLELSTGDANNRKTMSSKAYNNELNAYSDAIRQGVEPATTNMKDIQSAMKLSDLAGKAFDSTDNSFKG
jgi:hypothetical protein